MDQWTGESGEDWCGANFSLLPGRESLLGISMLTIIKVFLLGYRKLLLAVSSLWLRRLQSEYQTSHSTPSTTLNLLGDSHEIFPAG